MSALGDAALALAGRGLAVFPLRAATKVPAIAGGVTNATTDAGQIRAWWSKWPEANLAIATGASNLLVIDLDGPEAESWWSDRQDEYGEIETVTAISGRDGGGRHLYLATGGKTYTLSAGKLGPKVDTRGGVSYVLAPPSIHDETGRAYAWGPGRGLAPVPGWLDHLLEKAQEPKYKPTPQVAASGTTAYGAAALRNAVATVSAAREHRNNRINDAAIGLGHLVGGGVLTRGDVEQALLAAADACGYIETDGQRAALATINSGLDAGIREPRRPDDRPRASAPIGAAPFKVSGGARAQASWAAVKVDLLPADKPAPPSGPIPITQFEGTLDERMQQLLDQEGALEARGITCEIRDRSDSTCLACPVSRHKDTEDALGALCRVGRESDTVATHSIVAALQERRVGA